MPKRSSKRQETDPNVAAFNAVQHLIAVSEGRAPAKSAPEPPAKNPAAVELGRLGGLKGGKARAAKLSAKKRQEIARRAAQKRWAGRSTSSKKPTR
jgi:hypothetical protein